MLLYGLESWVISAADMKRLEVLQMRWLRCILNVSLHNHLKNTTIRERCCQQPQICDQIRKCRLRWFGHLCRMNPKRLPKLIFWSERPDGWKCPTNAPKLSWRNQLLTHRYFNNPLAKASTLAQDRVQWRAFVRDISFASNNQDIGLL